MTSTSTSVSAASGLGSATDLATALMPMSNLSAAAGLLLVGCLAWTIGPPRKLDGRLIRTTLIVLNPVVALASLTTPSMLYLLSAALLVFDGLTRLRAQPGDNSTVGLGLRLAGGAVLSNGALALYPLLFAVTPALSPWRDERRKISGFVMILWAPLAMLALSAAYLAWIWGWPDLSATPRAARFALGGLTPDAAGVRGGAMALSLIGLAAVAAGQPGSDERRLRRLEGGALWLVWILGAAFAWLLAG